MTTMTQMTTANALVSNSLPVPSALGSLDAYIGAVHRIPVLTVEDEQALARRFLGEEDLNAARELVHSHLRFVVHVARGYVKVATTKAQRKLFFNLRRSKKRLGWMNAEEVRVVAADLNVSEREVLEMESRLSGRDIGFDAPEGDDDDRAPPSPVAYLRAHEEDPSQIYERESVEDHQVGLLHEGLAKLDERSRDIVARRWLGNENKVTLQELADEYGVSAERIRQIEANALKKMRVLFAA